MSAPLVSVIIPVFNAEPYLEQCVSSVLGQTLKDIEVIAVNDGSTDTSGTILDKMAAGDSRLRVFHRTNQGVSSARNLGLQSARGTFIGFADADDWMEREMLEVMYESALRTGSDWVICNVTMHELNGRIENRLLLKDELIDVYRNRTNLLKSFIRFRFDYANWNKLYVTDIVRRNSLEFSNDMQIYEDLLFNLKYLAHASKMYVISRPLYHYRILNLSLKNRNTSMRIDQFNLLNSHFQSFTNSKKMLEEREMFRVEISRMIYNQFLHTIEIEALRKSETIMQFFEYYKKLLLKFSSITIYFPDAGIAGIQQVKKYILQRKWFGMFAFLLTIKNLKKML